MKSKGFTLVELMIALALAGIAFSLLGLAIKGESLLPSKESCISQGGKWSEGIQYGRWTQLCTYN
jgi:prepilin-type N-terminal cleavage/methylation domain-containing protein